MWVKSEGDYMRARLHLTAPLNWMNDPNGLIYYQGNYHIFYQHFPYACHWGTMHWGHAISKDLVNFEHLPIALYPSKAYDRNGCFSGSAISFNDKLYLYFTAIRYSQEDPKNIHLPKAGTKTMASQALIISDDGLTFDNQHEKHLIIDVLSDENIGDSQDTRDPKVWLGKNGHVYMILGSKSNGEKGSDGKVLFFESEDGVHFTYKNSFGDLNLGTMWECPDLFELKGQYYLVLSPQNIDQAPCPTDNSLIMPVDFEEATCTLSLDAEYSYLDYGLDFYAPQTFTDENGERVIIGWLRMNESIDQENWIGMMSFPRVLSHKDGSLYQQVHPNVANLFKIEASTIDFERPFLLKTELGEGDTIVLGGFELTIKNDRLYTNRKRVSINNEKLNDQNATPELGGNYKLEIYYDFHVFEIYVNGGRYVLSQVVGQLDREDTHINDDSCSNLTME